MILYDKDGKSFNIPHKIDIIEWKKNGYTENNPKSQDDGDQKAFKAEKAANDAKAKATKALEDAEAKVKQAESNIINLL